MPQRADVLYLLAQSQLRSGRLEQGRETLEQFQAREALDDEIRVLEARVRKAPDDHEARRRLIRRYLDDGRMQEGRTHLLVLRDAGFDGDEERRLTRRLEQMQQTGP